MKKKSLFFRLVLPLFLLAVIIRLVAKLSRPFADFYNRTVSAACRFLMAKLTGWFSFSLAEILVCLIPVFLILIIVFGIRSIKNGKRFRRYVAATLSVPMVIYTLFVATYAVGYQTTPLADRLGLRDEAVSADELYNTMKWVRDEANALSSSFTLTENGTVMPYDWDTMTDKLNEAYASLSEEYPFLQSHNTRLKRIMLSDPMTYTGIVGVYSFFTGESNINTTYPDYSTVFTAAHEMAHQRGIAPENEANFVAFLACTHASDPYLRYVGYLNMADYLANALYKADRTRYREMMNGYNTVLRTEVVAYSECYRAHRNETVHNVSSAMNNSYLISQGTPGEVAYGLVVDLAVAYYNEVIAAN